MKIIKRIDFLKLPENTVFSEYEPHWFGPLMIKGETRGNDWFEQDIADAIAIAAGDEYCDILTRAKDAGESVGMNFDVENRNGLYDENDRLYAVWEEQDVRHLINRLQRCCP